MEPIQFLIVILVGVALLLAITWITKQSSGLDKAYYQRRWKHVQKALSEGGSGERLAIIDADKLVDHALKAQRSNGSSMGERLRSSEGQLGKNYQRLWDAHKLRNRLVHEEVKLRGHDVKYAIRAYNQALKDLGAL